MNLLSEYRVISRIHVLLVDQKASRVYHMTLPMLRNSKEIYSQFLLLSLFSNFSFLNFILSPVHEICRSTYGTYSLSPVSALSGLSLPLLLFLHALLQIDRLEDSLQITSYFFCKPLCNLSVFSLSLCVLHLQGFSPLCA